MEQLSAGCWIGCSIYVNGGYRLIDDRDRAMNLILVTRLHRAKSLQVEMQAHLGNIWKALSPGPPEGKVFVIIFGNLGYILD